MELSCTVGGMKYRCRLYGILAPLKVYSRARVEEANTLP